MFSPGPSETNPRALKEMISPADDIWDEEFLSIYNEARDLLKEIFGVKRGEVVIMPNPSFGSMEASVLNFLYGKKVLTAVNGFFGAQFRDIVSIYSREWKEIRKERVPINLEEVDYGDFEYITVVHSETSAGIRNPVEEIPEEVFSVVDCVSSLGGMKFEMERWGIDVAFAGMQKAISGPPGISAIALSEEAVDELMDKKEVRSWYFDLRKWLDRETPYPATVPTQAIRGLRKALIEVVKEGESRIKRHERLAMAFRKAIIGMGLEMYPKCEECPGCSSKRRFCSDTITVFRSPFNSFKLIKEVMKFGILIKPGIGKMKQELIRIGHMGMTSNETLISNLLIALERGLKDLGFKIEESGLEIFREELKR